VQCFHFSIFFVGKFKKKNVAPLLCEIFLLEKLESIVFTNNAVIVNFSIGWKIVWIEA